MPIFNNLFPPVFLDAWGRTFVRTDPDECKIYFKLSSFNSLDEINRDAVQISFNHQNTNTSALSKTLYPSGIKIAPILIDDSREGQDKYYVKVTKEDLQSEDFLLNHFYQAQIRLVAATVTTPTDSRELDNWLNSNIDNFSQWSSIILLRGISKPAVVLNGFDQNLTTSFPYIDSTLSGKIVFTDALQQDRLREYRVIIYDNQAVPLQEGQWKYSGSRQGVNQIREDIKVSLQDNQTYTVKVQYVTMSGFSDSATFNFKIEPYQYASITGGLTADLQQETGRVLIKVTNLFGDATLDNVTVRRTSSKTNFSAWEDLHTQKITSSPLSASWYDSSVESGVLYKYGVQKRNSSGHRSNTITTSAPLMVVFDDIILTGQGKQLSVKFNPQVSSYSHVVSESLTDTIGSKYPFITRSGAAHYRTFSISGTISHLTDVKASLMQASPKDLYGENQLLYRKWRQETGRNFYTDQVLERDFREKVIQFLYSPHPKLFRSTPQGSAIVRLMNITLTPEMALGRRIYSFSATAYEVAQLTPFNLDKYKIQRVSKVQ